jgi:pseudouridine-5'-phosphate glycosidase
MPRIASEVHSVDPEVAAALATGEPVVALESTIISHGLPRPRNLEVAREVEAAVRAEGAVPATIGVVAGVARIGLDDAALELLATDRDVVKASVRDLGVVTALGRHAATTVAATSALAAGAGIGVFATGGLGGVHREAAATWDESADLVALARTPLVVVCAGVKSILDVAATLERLESLSVPVLGFRTTRFPGFYLSDSGHSLDWRVESAAEVAAVVRARRALGLGPEAVIVANPLPPDRQVDPALHDSVLEQALAELGEAGVSGKAVTPFLLERFHESTGGESLRANVEIILANARLAAQIAVELARQ